MRASITSAEMEYSQATEVRRRLELLRIEHDLAVEIGLDADRRYMADLKSQLATWEAAWIAAAVTDIAVTQAQLLGRAQG